MRETPLRQRYNAGLPDSMRSFWATRAYPSYAVRIHPALTSFADECCGMLARVIAYVGALALLAILGIHLWDQLPISEAVELAIKPGWSVDARAHPAFAISQFDLPEKTETYEIFQHPEGGRKDIIRFTIPDGQQGDQPVAELEIYRTGGEFVQLGPAVAEITRQSNGGRGLETAGVIDSKFGTVTLLRHAGEADGRNSCLGFLKRLDEPHLRISGWTCQGEALPPRRAAIGCMLNRLILLTAGDDPKLAELFARAELQWGGCAGSATAVASTDWVTDPENPILRGTL
jgi:hypothetical protein